MRLTRLWEDDASVQLESSYGAIRLSPDEWMEALGVDLFDEGVGGRIERLQWQLARRLLELGQIVVIEWGTWGRDERDALREDARALGAGVELHFLDEPREVLWDRVRERDMERRLGTRPLNRVDLEIYTGKFQRPDAAELPQLRGRDHCSLSHSSTSATHSVPLSTYGRSRSVSGSLC